MEQIIIILDLDLSQVIKAQKNAQKLRDTISQFNKRPLNDEQIAVINLCDFIDMIAL